MESIIKSVATNLSPNLRAFSCASFNIFARLIVISILSMWLSKVGKRLILSLITFLNLSISMPNFSSNDFPRQHVLVIESRICTMSICEFLLVWALPWEIVKISLTLSVKLILFISIQWM